MDNFELILCILNSGFSEVAMDAARKFGARGGTTMHGRGTATKEAEKIFNITIQPEKEIIMILANSKIKIINIAELCGIYSISYFNTAFKKEFGISPSQYRKKYSPLPLKR